MEAFLKELIKWAARFKGFSGFAALVLLIIMGLFSWLFSEGSFDPLIANINQLDKNQFFWLVMVPMILLFAVVVLVIVLSYQSSTDKPSQAVLYVVVHKKGDPATLICDAQVTLVLPEPQRKTTAENGAVNFTFSTIFNGKMCEINAQKDGYQARKATRIKLKHDKHIKLDLEPTESRPQ